VSISFFCTMCGSSNPRKQGKSCRSTCPKRASSINSWYRPCCVFCQRMLKESAERAAFRLRGQAGRHTYTHAHMGNSEEHRNNINDWTTNNDTANAKADRDSVMRSRCRSFALLMSHFFIYPCVILPCRSL
jgi:hypothetical protein